MKYKKLGRTDIDVSTICLGTMTFGEQNNQEDGFEQMDYALDQGVNFFDTAELYSIPARERTYGKTEEIVGNWISERSNRDKVIIASKISGARCDWIRGGSDISAKTVLEAVEGSLTRLKTDYIDLYQLHWPNRNVPTFSNYYGFTPEVNDYNKERDDFNDILESLDQLVKSGKIRHAGLSNETSWGALEFLKISENKQWPRMASIQNEYSLVCRKAEGDLSEVCLAEDIGILAYSPLAWGYLTGKYMNGAIPPKSRLTIDGASDFMTYRATSSCLAAVDEYYGVAKKHNLDFAQMSLAFVNSKPFVTSNIIGATTMDQLKSNISSVDIVLTQDVIDEIEVVRKKYPIPY